MLEDEISQEVGIWEFSTPPVPRFSALVLHKETQGEESHKPGDMGQREPCLLLLQAAVLLHSH